jgi:hypothetical protein
MAWAYFPVERGYGTTEDRLNELRYAAAERSIAVPAALSRGQSSSKIISFVGSLMTNIKNASTGFGYWDHYNSASDFRWVNYWNSATSGDLKNIFEAALGAGVTDWRHSIARGDPTREDVLNDVYLVLDKYRIRSGVGAAQPRVYIGRQQISGIYPFTLAGWTSARDAAWSYAAMTYGGTYAPLRNQWPDYERWYTWFLHVADGYAMPPNPLGWIGSANKHLSDVAKYHAPPVSSVEDVPDPSVGNLYVNCDISGVAYASDGLGFRGINRTLVVELRQDGSAPGSYSRAWGTLVESHNYSGQATLARVYRFPGGTDKPYFGFTLTTSSEDGLTEAGTNLHLTQQQPSYVEEMLTGDCFHAEWEMAYVKMTPAA